MNLMSDPITNEWTTGTIEMSISGTPIKMELTVPATNVKPNRMLPIFQQMTNAFVDISIKAVEAEGKTISCKAGCGACCSQPVPIAETEVYHIAEVVEQLPEPRRTIVKQKFADAVAHFTELDWFDRMRTTAARAATEPREKVVEAIQKIALEYFNESVSCPFLDEGSCSIHPVRPIACREYLVTSPAENCSNPTAGTVNKIDLFIKASDTVRTVGRTDKFRKMGFIPLIKALALAEEYPESFVEKKGQRWVADFFEQLTRSKIPKKGLKPRNRTLKKRRPKK